jgi:hypothetical protein
MCRVRAGSPEIRGYSPAPRKLLRPTIVAVVVEQPARRAALAITKSFERRAVSNSAEEPKCVDSSRLGWFGWGAPWRG